jgi:phosphoribosylglycinamide formyltransferase 1
VSHFRVAVLASGTGTNLQAILDRVHGRDGIEVVGVGSNRPEAMALERAREADVATATFPAGDHPDRRARDAAIGDWLERLDVDLVVLAGYMELLSPELVARFENRIINVHPALLPSFPGLDPHGQALRAGAKISGATVHFVIPETDAGPIVAQAAVPVREDDTAETLAARVLAVEHRLYPLALRLVAEGRVRIVDGRCLIDGVRAADDDLFVPPAH